MAPMYMAPVASLVLLLTRSTAIVEGGGGGGVWFIRRLCSRTCRLRVQWGLQEGGRLPTSWDSTLGPTYLDQL